jgi:hypothetical protein
MTATTGYPSDRFGLLLVGPYNDFLSEGGIQPRNDERGA